MSASLDDLFVHFKIPWVDGVVPIKMWSFHNVDHRTNNTSEGENTIVLNLNNSYSLPSIYIQAYNLRFATRLSRKHPNIWSFIQLIQSEHARFEHILIQLDTLYNRFHEKEINAKELLS
ncbi:unnamed protein product, partial [Rotaria magnacalcarata]